MKHKVIILAPLLIILTSILTLTFIIQPAKASGTIYIRADGSIEPPTANITSLDNVTYTFTGNNHDSIVIERDNIVVDGAGYTVQGTNVPDSNGINLTQRINVTIRNMEIRAFYYGIYLSGSSNNSIVGNNITNNRLDGILLYYSSSNTLTGNSITNNVASGVSLHSSSYNMFKNNSMIGSYFNFEVWGSALSHLVQDIDASNTVDGKPIYYLINCKNLAINPSTSPNIGYLALINSINITVKGLELKNNGQGILLANTTNSQISTNIITINTFGIELFNSSNNSISGNNIKNNGVGLSLDCSSNNSISGNKITNNKYGIPPNVFSNCNIISGNNIIDNDYGIRLHKSSNNIIYHNNFVNNTQQVDIVWSGYANFWDNGFEGNYWSDYNGTDIDQDGIGDTPYIIDENNTDNYPLMGMFSDFPISSIDFIGELEKIFHVTTISNSTIIDFGIYPIILPEETGGVIVLDVTGPDGTKGFCRFTIPKDLLDCPEGLEAWTVRLNGTDVTLSCNIWENSTHTFIYVPYNHSIQEIMVEGTKIVPEFPSALILPLLMIVTIVAVVLRKRHFGHRVNIFQKIIKNSINLTMVK